MLILAGAGSRSHSGPGSHCGPGSRCGPGSGSVSGGPSHGPDRHQRAAADQRVPRLGTVPELMPVARAEGGGTLALATGCA